MYDLVAAGSDAQGLRSVEVTDPLTGRSYHLEFRDGLGRDAGAIYTSPRGQVPSIAGGRS